MDRLQHFTQIKQDFKKQIMKSIMLNYDKKRNKDLRSKENKKLKIDLMKLWVVFEHKMILKPWTKNFNSFWKLTEKSKFSKESPILFTSLWHMQNEILISKK